MCRRYAIGIVKACASGPLLPAVLLLLQLAFVSPAIAQTAKTMSPLQSAQTQIDQLRRQIAVLQSRMAGLAEDNEKLSSRVLTLELTKEPYKFAVLDLSSRAYERIDTDSGTFFISVKDASPYVDGYRIKVCIGNPYDGAYNGFKLKVTWNVALTKIKDLGWDKWKENERTKEASYTDVLQPGTWTTIDLLLPATAPDQLGYVTLVMETDTIALRIN